MSDYRQIEIVVCVIGLQENPMTGEQGNTIIPIRKQILINETMPLADVAMAISVMITEFEDKN